MISVLIELIELYEPKLLMQFKLHRNVYNINYINSGWTQLFGHVYKIIPWQLNISVLYVVICNYLRIHYTRTYTSCSKLPSVNIVVRVQKSYRACFWWNRRMKDHWHFIIVRALNVCICRYYQSPHTNGVSIISSKWGDLKIQYCAYMFPCKTCLLFICNVSVCK